MYRAPAGRKIGRTTTRVNARGRAALCVLLLDRIRAHEPLFPDRAPLVKRGHSVTYLSSVVFKDAIEATGAAFVDEAEELSELMQPDPAKPRAENFMSAFLALATRVREGRGSRVWEY